MAIQSTATTGITGHHGRIEIAFAVIDMLLELFISVLLNMQKNFFCEIILLFV